jgi:hypothetical protein
MKRLPVVYKCLKVERTPDTAQQRLFVNRLHRAVLERKEMKGKKAA